MNQWDDEFIIRTIENLAALYLEMLYEIDVELPVAVEHLKTRVTDLQAWAEIFISGRPRVSLNDLYINEADRCIVVRCRGEGPEWNSFAHEY